MSFSTEDTIVAIATPAGRGGLGVVRVSGPEARRIGQAICSGDSPLEPRRATLARVNGPDGPIDRAILTCFPAPHSYTGEDVLEISAHGSPVLLRSLVSAVMAEGARLAEPGEFTLRAFLNGRIDLVQAEAVRDLVDAVTPRQARAAFDQLEGTLTDEIRAIDASLLDLVARLEASLDFPEEGYHFLTPADAGAALSGLADRLSALLADAARGRLVREGAQVALVGRPNTGKSSLFNRLAGAGRAIVTDIPGTTRDLLTETVDVEGIPITLVDTAGLRVESGDAIELEGMARAAAVGRVADLVLIVLDRSRPLNADDERVVADAAGRPHVVVANKTDLGAAWTPANGAVAVSALSGEGLDTLRTAIAAALGAREADRDTPALTNVRHAALVDRARAAVARAAAAAASAVSEEFVLADLHEGRAALEEITGARTPDDVLRHIFTKFCIGK